MTPTERILAALTDRNCDPKQNGKGWSASCPAHEDQRPSLSVTEGDDGRALVRCHAGCSADAVCGALGLRVADLMTDDPPAVSTSTQLPNARGNKQRRRQPSGNSPKTYPTTEAAIEALEGKHGKRSALWTYHNANGEPVGVVVRWNLPDGKKDIRPVAKHDGGWRIGGMPEPRPLYCLPDLAGAQRVYITEGEKAADAARAIGLVATTSAHGSQSPGKTDWTPLADKECVILPDHDDPGGKYADTVAAILVKLEPPAKVKIVELPDLPKGGDIVEWIDSQGDVAEPEAMATELIVLAESAELVEADLPVATPSKRILTFVERYRPFPAHVLPEPVRSFVEAGAKAIGCDASYVALPLLTALAAIIGNALVVLLKRGWCEPAILWTVLVGDSGSMKTPAFKLALKPLRNRQGQALKQHAQAMQNYREDLAHYEKALTGWKRDKKTIEPAPEPPEEPTAERCLVTDTTVEALAPILLANPSGLLLARDELNGWLGSFDRYSGGKGGDASHWLSMHGGESILVDRKTGVLRTIHVPLASVSVTGGIQPGILRRALGSEHRESGLAARLLLAFPPREQKRWNEDDIDPQREDDIEQLFDRLAELTMIADEEENLRPVVIGLNSGAKQEWVRYYNEHAQEQVEQTGDLAAAWSKLEAYAARLALVVHCCRWAAGGGEPNDLEPVDAASMEAGIELAQWFKNEARRVYAMLAESEIDEDRRRLTEWIGRKGGSVTAREVQQGHRQYRTAQDAEAALDELGKAGWGEWHDAPPGPKGGRPSRVFRLPTASTSTKPHKIRDSGGFVDVDSVDAPGTQNHDWGEV